MRDDPRIEFEDHGLGGMDFRSPTGVANTSGAGANASAGAGAGALRVASHSGHERNRLFINGDAGRAFADVSGISGADSPADGRSLAVADLDRDGRADLVLVNANAPLLQIFRNTTDRPGNLIAVRLEGAQRPAAQRPATQRQSEQGTRRSNRSAIGARVTVFPSKGEALIRELRAGEGFAAQNSSTLLFGLGAAEKARGIEVSWPSGRRQRHGEVAAGTLVIMREADAGGVEEGGQMESRPYIIPTPSRAAGSRDQEKSWGPALPRALARACGDGPGCLIIAMASWCEACASSLLALGDPIQRARDAGFGVVGVPIDPADGRSRLLAWERKHSPPYPLLSGLAQRDRLALARILEEQLGQSALPAACIALSPPGDRRGAARVFRAMSSIPTVSDIREAIRHLQTQHGKK